METPRFAGFLRASLVLALGLASGAMSGCSSESPPPAPEPESAGSIRLDLRIGSAVINAINYTATGPNAFTRSGTVDVSSSSMVGFVVGGIPAGSGYALSIAASSADAQVTCTGNAGPFSVISGATTTVTIDVLCHESATTGSVVVTGTVDACPAIDIVTASSAQADVGAPIALIATAHDTDSDPSTLTYVWTSVGGSIADRSAGQAQFTCAAPGTATVTLTVSDGQCDDSTSFDVTCTPAPVPTCDAGCPPPPPVPLTTGEDGINALAVDGTNVYFTTSDSVRKVPIIGGTSVTLASGMVGTSGIAVDNQNVYWTVAGRVRGVVMSLPLAGGTPTTLASLQATPMGIAVDGANAYWTSFDSGNVSKVPLAGGPTTVLATSTGFPFGIAVNGDNVFWTDQLNLMKVSVGGGPLTKLSPDLGSSIAVDGSSVYWTAAGATTASVMKVPFDGGTPTTLATFPRSAPYENYRIAVDNTSVYWTSDAAGTVTKLPVGGGTPVTIASGQSTPQFIIVDSTSVYWVNFANGTLMKLTPK